MKNHRIVVLGWDGATWDVLRPWVTAGELPNLAHVLAEGAAGELRSVIPPTTAPAWTSMTTGTWPGKHGLMDWITRRPGEYRITPVTADFCTQKTMWELLSEAGRRVFTFNVPMTYPVRPLNGLVVAGLGVPTVDSAFTYPPGLYQEILAEVGGEYILHPNPGQPDSDRRVEAFLERLYQVTEIHTKTLDLMRAKERWDGWMAVVSGTDAIQHVMWRFLDPTCNQYDPRKSQRFRGEVLRYFQHVDRYLGQIVSHLDDDTVLLLTSDHGFGPLNKWFQVNTWLLQEGFIVLKPGVWPRLKRQMFRLGFTPMNAYNLLRAIGMGRLKEEVTPGRGQGRLRALLPKVFLSFDDVDWSRTRAYAIGQIGQIFLNLKGREPEGIVEPGEEAERVREEIVAHLRKVHDPDSGAPIVGKVYRPEELYPGPHTDRVPDITFMPPEEARNHSPGFGEVDFGTNRIHSPMRGGLSGIHRMNGLFAAFGKPIQPGTWIEGARIVDVAPTALHLAGLPIPEDMDGRVLAEALRPEYAAEAVHRGPAARRVDQGTAEFLSGEDEAVVQERLRGLGYAA